MDVVEKEAVRMTFRFFTWATGCDDIYLDRITRMKRNGLVWFCRDGENLFI